MKGSWFEALRHRLSSTWAVFTGRAYAGYHQPIDVGAMVADAEIKESGRVFLGEFNAFWNDPLHMKHPDAVAYMYLRNARDRFEASLSSHNKTAE